MALVTIRLTMTLMMMAGVIETGKIRVFCSNGNPHKQPCHTNDDITPGEICNPDDARTSICCGGPGNPLNGLTNITKCGNVNSEYGRCCLRLGQPCSTTSKPQPTCCNFEPDGTGRRVKTTCRGGKCVNYYGPTALRSSHLQEEDDNGDNGLTPEAKIRTSINESSDVVFNDVVNRVSCLTLKAQCEYYGKVDCCKGTRCGTAEDPGIKQCCLGFGTKCTNSSDCCTRYCDPDNGNKCYENPACE